jgi:predicted DNA binding CopG/RHH family protein
MSQSEDKTDRYTVRLRVRDVEEMKKRAVQTGATWVGYLRVLVQRALEKKETVR